MNTIQVHKHEKNEHKSIGSRTPNEKSKVSKRGQIITIFIEFQRVVKNNQTSR